MGAPKNKADDIPLAIEPRMKWLVNNHRFADVTFAVGEEEEIVYAHKSILASGSPVFEKMFFANHDLQMTGLEPIEIPDLTATGFINMLKYIYTNNFKDFNLSELFETFMAGDKYQVYKMNDAMFSFTNDVLDESNCCIIYDQLMMFPSEYVSVPIEKVRAMIRCNSKSAFKNNYFVNISRETLVDLLSMNTLTIDEIDVLKVCAKWVDWEIERLNLEPNATNKQEIFKPIKNLIRFSEISLDELRNFGPIKDLLSSDELSSLFLHHLHVAKFTIECSAARKKLTLRSAFCNAAGNINQNNYHYSHIQTHQNFSQFSQVFKASGDMLIAKIYSFLPTTVQDLELSITSPVNGTKVALNYEKLCLGNTGWDFRFIDPIKIDAAKEYEFAFKFQNSSISYNKLSRATAMIISSGSSLQCNISSLTNGYHCLKQIDFYEVS